MFEKLNTLMAGILPGSKTNLSGVAISILAQILVVQGVIAQDDVVTFTGWIEQMFTSLEGIIALLGPAVPWFRQIGKRGQS